MVTPTERVAGLQLAQRLAPGGVHGRYPEKRLRFMSWSSDGARTNFKMD